MASLKTWAESLTTTDSPEIDNTTRRAIQFRFREFSDIAEVIARNIARQKEAIRNEQEFLQYSSHELRSPLAVMKTNIELLERILYNAPEKQRKVVRRIGYAASTMSGIVNTFLWLSRSQTETGGYETITLNDIIDNVVEENRYLINSKPLEIVVSLSPFFIQLPSMPCRIVVSNIISNAFKHASSGEILIQQTGSILRVINNEELCKDETHDTGFGLGLRLVQKIAGHYGWTVNTDQRHGLYMVDIDFKTSHG